MRREVRLRPEFAHLYPGLTPGVWEPAARVAEAVLTEFALRRMGRMSGQERLLNKDHFEFRGGDPAPPMRQDWPERWHAPEQEGDAP